MGFTQNVPDNSTDQGYRCYSKSPLKLKVPIGKPRKHHGHREKPKTMPSEAAVLESTPGDERKARVLTKAERSFEQMRCQRELARAMSLAKVGYNQRIQKFNTLMATMSEHYDMPKSSSR